MAKEPNSEEIAWNLRSQLVYPLGAVDVIWNTLDRLWEQSSGAEKKAVEKVFDSLEKYDSLLRKRLRTKNALPPIKTKAKAL